MHFFKHKKCFVSTVPFYEVGVFKLRNQFSDLDSSSRPTAEGESLRTSGPRLRQALDSMITMIMITIVMVTMIIIIIVIMISELWNSWVHIRTESPSSGWENLRNSGASTQGSPLVLSGGSHRSKWNGPGTRTQITGVRHLDKKEWRLGG